MAPPPAPLRPLQGCSGTGAGLVTGGLGLEGLAWGLGFMLQCRKAGVVLPARRLLQLSCVFTPAGMMSSFGGVYQVSERECERERERERCAFRGWHIKRIVACGTAITPWASRTWAPSQNSSTVPVCCHTWGGGGGSGDNFKPYKPILAQDPNPTNPIWHFSIPDLSSISHSRPDKRSYMLVAITAAAASDAPIRQGFNDGVAGAVTLTNTASHIDPSNKTVVAAGAEFLGLPPENQAQLQAAGCGVCLGEGCSCNRSFPLMGAVCDAACAEISAALHIIRWSRPAEILLDRKATLDGLRGIEQGFSYKDSGALCLPSSRRIFKIFSSSQHVAKVAQSCSGSAPTTLLQSRRPRLLRTPSSPRVIFPTNTSSFPYPGHVYQHP